MRVLAAVCFSLALFSMAAPGFAGDGVQSTGVLSDNDLFRSMACGAGPRAACQTAFVRWNKPELRVVLTCDPSIYPEDLGLAVAAALDQAIDSLIAVESGLRLRRVADQPDILVQCTSLSEGDVTKAIPNMTDGQQIGEAFTQINWDDDMHLTSATIVVSRTISMDVLRSVVLEELFQALGFPYDVENPAYEGVSILSQTSDATIAITGQDAAVLRLHYPPS